MSLSLGALARLPIEERAQFVERFGRDDLIATIEHLQHAGSACARVVTPRRIAWAMAYNLHDPDAPLGFEGGAVNPRFLENRRDSHWSVDTPWPSVWDYYLATLGTTVFATDREHPASCTLLRELARSVACERRADWPWSPGPVDDNAAAESVAETWTLARGRVVEAVVKLDGVMPLLEDIVATTTPVVLDKAWGPKARSRFAALALVSSWLASIALNVARNQIRTEVRLRKRERPWLEDHANTIASDAPGIDDQLIRRQEAELVRTQIRDCIDRLPERDRQLLRDLGEGVGPLDIARARMKTPAAVTYDQKKLLERLQHCFEGRRAVAGVRPQTLLKRMREALAALGNDFFDKRRRS